MKRKIFRLAFFWGSSENSQAAHAKLTCLSCPRTTPHRMGSLTQRCCHAVSSSPAKLKTPMCGSCLLAKIPTTWLAKHVVQPKSWLQIQLTLYNTVFYPMQSKAGTGSAPRHGREGRPASQCSKPSEVCHMRSHSVDGFSNGFPTKEDRVHSKTRPHQGGDPESTCLAKS